ncbi:MAG TPA: extracellular solute-binding protein [Candidatus Paceibacterota bacterium]|jgi:ABC-type sugar transport system, periplasmic component
MSRFQIIFTTILVFLGVGGAILFAVSKNHSTSQGAVHLTLWGALPSGQVTSFLSELNQQTGNAVNVSYVEKNAVSMETELVSALARGQGPDLILLPQDLVVPQSDKFYVMPFENYSERTFRDSFVQEGELFLTPSGVMGLPFSLDPVVMYWNRTLLTDAGIAKPPVSWVEFYALAPKLVKKDANGNIVQSLVAFGETRNVTHADDMLSLLALQAGTPVVWRNQGAFQSALTARIGSFAPAEEALSFFTEFSNPVKTSYSWNRSLPNDRALFVGGKLAVYFGYASEAGQIRAANPNLDFDVALVPQTDAQSGGRTLTFGRINAVALLKSSPNLASAFQAAVTMTNAQAQSAWIAVSGLPPVRRDMLVQIPGDALKAISYKSALIAQGWLEPGPQASAGLFQRMVDNVTSGRMRVSESVTQASGELDTLLQSQI